MHTNLYPSKQAMPITAINDNKDVHVNVSHITGILRDSLGRPDPRGPPVLPAYYWNRVLPGCLAGNASREDCYTGETSTGPGGWGRRHSM